MYPDGCVNGIEYKDIQYINDKDWHSLMSICRSFNYIIEKEEFWNTLLSLLREAIYDFDKIFSIYKTKNVAKNQHQVFTNITKTLN